MTELPTVTVAVPVRNEEDRIGDCLAAIEAQTYANIVEVLVIDGRSDDCTVVRAQTTGAVQIVGNPEIRQSAGLNRALAIARGAIFVRVDARSRVQPDYVERCVATLTARGDVGVVGGAQLAHSGSGRALHRGIARALQNKLTTGLSRYRRLSSSGPADTVWMGAFRTNELRDMGGWDAGAAINEDYELNARYRAAGELVWFDSALRSEYVPRTTMAAIAGQHFRYGRAKGEGWAQGQTIAPRQLVLLALPPGALLGLAAVSLCLGSIVAIGAVFVGASLVDWLGSNEPASVSCRVVAIGASAVIAASWWTGVIVGAVRARLVRPVRVTTTL